MDPPIPVLRVRIRKTVPAGKPLSPPPPLTDPSLSSPTQKYRVCDLLVLGQGKSVPAGKPLSPPPSTDPSLSSPTQKSRVCDSLLFSQMKVPSPKQNAQRPKRVIKKSLKAKEAEVAMATVPKLKFVCNKRKAEELPANLLHHKSTKLKRATKQLNSSKAELKLQQAVNGNAKSEEARATVPKIKFVFSKPKAEELPANFFHHKGTELKRATEQLKSSKTDVEVQQAVNGNAKSEIKHEEDAMLQLSLDSNNGHTEAAALSDTRVGIKFNTAEELELYQVNEAKAFGLKNQTMSKVSAAHEICGNYKNKRDSSLEGDSRPAAQRMDVQRESEEREKKDEKKKKLWNPLPELDLDLSNSKQRPTPNYCLLSDKDELTSSVLNQTVKLQPSGGYNYKKCYNKYEEALFKCEDERYEFDILMESMKSSMINVETVLEKMLKGPIPIEEHLTPMNLRCIEMLYGQHGIDVVDLVRQKPNEMLPVVLRRLKQKNQELEQFSDHFNKIWVEVYAYNIPRSLIAPSGHKREGKQADQDGVG